MPDPNNALFDKIINVYLYNGNPSDHGELIQTTTSPDATKVYAIECPLYGMKPWIGISGEMISSNLLNSIDVKIKNFVTVGGDISLTDFKYIRIVAGYRGGIQTSIEGSIVNRYQESAGPDGVTVFHVLQGDYFSWNTSLINTTFQAGIPLKSAYQTIIAEMPGFDLYDPAGYFDHNNITLVAPLSVNGLCKNALVELTKTYGQIIPLDDKDPKSGPYCMDFIDGKVVIYPQQSGTGNQYTLNFLNSAPAMDSGSMSAIAPWLPTIRAFDTVNISSVYVRQTYGAALKTVPYTKFTVLRYKFDFNTVEDSNTMNLYLTPSVLEFGLLSQVAITQ